MNKRVVLQDIADALHVSKNTVSHALRDLNDISEPLKEKIKNKAAEMGYIPNNLSIFLRENKSKLIGIVTCDLINPYYSIQIDKLIKKVHEQGYLAITILTDSGYLDFEVFKYLLNYQVGAIISFQDLSQETYDFIKIRTFPIILYGLLSKFENVPSVYSDDYEGGKIIAQECIKLNAKKPCFIAWDINIDTSKRRMQGFIDELEKNNIKADIYNVGYTEQSNYKVIKENQNDFVFAYCDTLGIQLKDYLNTLDYNNYTLYGFDGISCYLKTAKMIKSAYANSEAMSKYTALEIKKSIENINYKIKSKKFSVSLYTND